MVLNQTCLLQKLSDLLLMLPPTAGRHILMEEKQKALLRPYASLQR